MRRAFGDPEHVPTPPLHVPDLETVLARLRAGAHIQAGGGRYSRTFFFEGADLRCEIFDEGEIRVYPSTNDELKQAIADYPADFR